MSKLTSREVRLASRPEGVPAATNFTLVRTELEPLKDREVLVRNLFMSVDPYMRGRMNEGQSYVPPFELGKPLDGGAVGEVVESRANEFRVGDAVTSSRGWREYFIASPPDTKLTRIPSLAVRSAKSGAGIRGCPYFSSRIC
jgi:NADPH-dependent curcumin reductase CurA